MKHVLGLDVAKAKLDVALLFPNGKYHRRQVENTPAGLAILSTWLAKREVVDLHVCMEATGPYWEGVAEFLVDNGHRVSVVNPAQIKEQRLCLAGAHEDRSGRCPADRSVLSGPEPRTLDASPTGRARVARPGGPT